MCASPSCLSRKFLGFSGFEKLVTEADKQEKASKEALKKSRDKKRAADHAALIKKASRRVVMRTNNNATDGEPGVVIQTYVQGKGGIPKDIGFEAEAGFNKKRNLIVTSHCKFVDCDLYRLIILQSTDTGTVVPPDCDDKWGCKFDSTYDHVDEKNPGGEPYKFRLGMREVLDCWDIAVEVRVVANSSSGCTL